jgi:CRP-like cAMP-binding protein
LKGEDLKVFALLAAFTDEDREALADVLEERTLVEGKSAFREGSEGEGLVLLVEGQLNLKSKRYGGFVGTITAPHHLGAVSLFSMGMREVTAVAEASCKLWTLSRSGLWRLADDAPRAAFRLAEAAMSELAGLTRPGIEALVEFDRD